MESRHYRDTLRLEENRPVILNLGLFSAGSYNDGKSGERLKHYMKAIREIMKPGMWAGVSLDIDEPTLVVEGEFNERASSTTRFYDCLSEAKQDCCAIWFADTGEGFLYGQKPGLWGEFDSALFTLPPHLRQTAAAPAVIPRRCYGRNVG